MIGIYIYLLIGLISALLVGDAYRKIKDGEDEVVDDTRKFLSENIILGGIYIIITLTWPYFILRKIFKK